jgi:predicted secreted protein
MWAGKLFLQGRPATQYRHGLKTSEASVVKGEHDTVQQKYVRMYIVPGGYFNT